MSPDRSTGREGPSQRQLLGANIGVGIDHPGRLTVRDSEITDSAGWGIILDDGELVAENNSDRNNAEGDIRR